MGKISRQGSRRYPGVRWVDSQRHGRVFYIRYRQGRRLIEEKVGSEAEGYTAELAATVRGHRVQALRHGEELPVDRRQLATLREVWKEYWRWAEQHKRSAAWDETRWRLHLEPRFGDRLPDEILGGDLERLAAELGADHAPATVRQVLTLFGRLWRFGQEERLIPRRAERPRVRRLPQVHNERERALTAAEVAQLLAELRPRSPTAYGLTLLGYHTGARRRELLRLTWGDVDLVAGVVVFPDTKTGGPRRVPLNADAVAYLEPRQGKPGERVFPSVKHGGEIGTVTSAWQAAADRLFNPPGTPGSYRVVFHTLRHSFTSRLVALGTPLPTVQRLTGHKTLAMLARYAHLAPAEGRAAVRLLETGPPQAKSRKKRRR